MQNSENIAGLLMLCLIGGLVLLVIALFFKVITMTIQEKYYQLIKKFRKKLPSS